MTFSMRCVLARCLSTTAQVPRAVMTVEQALALSPDDIKKLINKGGLEELSEVLARNRQLYQSRLKYSFAYDGCNPEILKKRIADIDKQQEQIQKAFSFKN